MHSIDQTPYNGQTESINYEPEYVKKRKAHVAYKIKHKD